MFDLNKIRDDFPMIKNHPDLIYFDSAATAFKPQCVINAVNDYYTNLSVNVNRGDYELSYMVSKEFDETRELVKQFLNANSEKEIVFTSGASASLNLVAYGYGMKYLKKGDVILSTEAEHASNILPWFKVAETTGAEIKYIPLQENGKLDIADFEKVMNEDVKVVSITWVSNVLGYVLPIKEICKIAHKYGAVVVVDGAQGVPHLYCDVQDMDCDFLSFSAHKLCGPSGVGVLYGKYELLKEMDALMLGGGSNARFDICGNILLKDPPLKFEAGTPCIEGVLGMRAAISYLMDIGMKEIEEEGKVLSKYFTSKMQELDHIKIYNPDSDAGIMTFNVEGIFAQDVATYLANENICVRAGNHCAKILLNVIGASETVRASLYLYNSKAEIDRFTDLLKDISLEKCIGALV